MLESHSGRLHSPCKRETKVLVGSNPTSSSIYPDGGIGRRLRRVPIFTSYLIITIKRQTKYWADGLNLFLNIFIIYGNNNKKEIKIMPKLQPYTKDWLQELCLNSYSLAEVLKKAGRKQGGGSQATLKKKIEEYQIDISHFTGQTWNKGKTSSDDSRIKATRKIDNEKILCENSLVSRSVLRRRIIAENLLEYKCSSCNNTGEWLN